MARGRRQFLLSRSRHFTLSADAGAERYSETKGTLALLLTCERGVAMLKKRISLRQAIRDRDEQPPKDSIDLSEVEISSEDPDFPIEHALGGGENGGWVAKAPGRQTIRLTFQAPTRLNRIRLVFREESRSRTQ